EPYPPPPPWPPGPHPAVPYAAPPQRRARDTVLRIVWTLIPLFTCGVATPFMLAYAAARLRSRALAAATAGYGAGLVIWITVAGHYPAIPFWADALAVTGWLATWLGGTVHAFALRRRLFGPRPNTGERANEEAVAKAMFRRMLREKARELAERDPSLARELRIGRPDLPREYDDGGVVDVNHAPASVIATLPGMTPHLAEEVVRVRERLGRFVSAEDVAVAVNLSPHVVPELAEHSVYLQRSGRRPGGPAAGASHRAAGPRPGVPAGAPRGLAGRTAPAEEAWGFCRGARPPWREPGPWVAQAHGAGRGRGSRKRTARATAWRARRPRAPEGLPPRTGHRRRWYGSAERDLHHAGERELQEGERHQAGPGEPLELVLPEPGEAHPHPDHHEGEGEHLDQGPHRAGQQRAVPAAEEEHGGERGEHHDPGVLRQHEQREPQPGVLGHRAHDELGLGDRHVERRAAQLGEPGDEEHHRADRLPGQPPPLPPLDDPGERQGAGRHGHAGGGEHQGQLVGHELGRRPDAAEQAELVPRRPPGHDRPEHADAHHREHEEQAAVEVHPDQPRADRDHHQHRQVRHERHRRGEGEHPAVGRGRDDVLLLDELDPVRDELRPPVEPARVHRPEAGLHVGHGLVLHLPDDQR